MYNKNQWTNRGLQEIAERAVERAIVFANGAHIHGVVLEPVTPEPGKQILQLTVIGSADEGEAYEEYYEIPTIIQGQRCTTCERLANTYFTGILQLRKPNETVSHEIERRLGTALSAVKDVTGGIDYYVTDHRILQNVARAVHDMFGGELTVRAQHFSYDNLASKNLYRVNACLRLPKFWKGDVIWSGTKLVKILSMGRLLKCKDLMSGKILSLPCKNEYGTYPTTTTSVVTVRPKITILEPETYQTVSLAVELAEFKDIVQGQQITIVEKDGEYFLVDA